MSRHRVVVTGPELASPMGSSVAEGWANLVVGKPRITTITRFDPSNLAVHFAGEVKGFNAEEYIPAKETRNVDTFIHYDITAGMQTLKDSGLEVTEANAEHIGMLAGSGIDGLPMIEDTHQTYIDRGPRHISPFFVPGSIISMVSDHPSIMFGLKGPNLIAIAACTTGLHSIGLAACLVQAGGVNAMVAGDAESTVSPLGTGGSAAARALSMRNDDPAMVSRPWDKGRDSFVLGEGVGVVVLGEYESAKTRGAAIYVEVAGFGMSGDTFYMTAPNMDGPRRYMLSALRDVGMNADQVHCLSTHGTSTPLDDKNESEAIKAAFGDHAAKIVVSSTRSMTDHLLGSAGGLESMFTVPAPHDQVSPPTIDIFNQDPECDLDYCANTARDMKIDVAVKNNFGFGGTNGMLVFKRP